MNKLLPTFVLLLIISLPAFSQNINGRFSSSFYSFERFDSTDASVTHFRTFQLLNLNFGKDKVYLRTSMNLEADLAKDLVTDPRLRFYNLYVDARNLWDLVSFKIGRQPLFNSIAGGVFDGATVGLKFNSYKFQVFYGGNVPAYQKLELTENWSDNYVLGGGVTIYALQDWQFGLKYINKNFRSNPYLATRTLAPDYDPITIEIANKSLQYQFISGEVSYYKENFVRINTKYEYDLNFNTTSKIELDGRYEKIKNLGLTLYTNYRQPKIRYNSIFSVFDFGNTWEVEGGADYRLNGGYTVLAKVANVSYKEESSQRLTAGLSTPYGTITGRMNLGYAGELSTVSFYGALPVFEGLVTPSLGLSYTSYKQSSDSPTNNLTSVLGGVNVRPFRMLSFDVQGQYINNKIYKDDWRMFFKLNFWFNSNF